jgi:hypothetical protein
LVLSSPKFFTMPIREKQNYCFISIPVFSGVLSSSSV